MSKIKELFENHKDIQIAMDYAVMECKMEMLAIISEQPTIESKLAAIKDYLLGRYDDN